MASRNPTPLPFSTSPQTWTNMPAAQTEFLGGTAFRQKAGLADFDQVRLCVRVTTAGAAGAVLAVQYSPDEVTWTTLGNTVPINTTGTKASALAAIPAGAKGDVFLRLGGQGGDGAADPAFGLISLQLLGSATVERAGLVTQVVSNVYGLVRDMRDNAAGYKARVAANQPVATVAAVMVGDANEYLRRIQWVTDAFARNNALMDAALGDLGLTTAQATALRDTLQSVANHTKAADLSSGAVINTESDFILANVPAYERLW